jgi:DNA primase
MTNNHFSSDLLHSLRNNIPINNLIENILKVPCEINQGTFRFLCPQCNGLDTKINPQKNLARCFKCQKNFNPIDIVMAVKRVKFKAAVNFLMKQFNNNKSLTPQLINNKTYIHNHLTNNRPSENRLIPINRIIPAVIEKVKSKKDLNETYCDGCLSLSHRLENAEKELKEIKFQMIKLQMLMEQCL